MDEHRQKLIVCAESLLHLDVVARITQLRICIESRWIDGRTAEGLSMGLRKAVLLAVVGG